MLHAPRRGRPALGLPARRRPHIRGRDLARALGGQDVSVRERISRRGQEARDRARPGGEGMSASLIALVTALADDELIIGHRHSEWTGFAPHIEEDVAFSSIAQDEIGHAAALYGIVASLTDDDPDRLALGRSKDEYRHAVICERPNREWSYTLARHWLYDNADDIRLEALEGSAHEDLAALATKVRREERWHLLHADTWIRRIARGPVEGRTKLEDAVIAALPDAGGIFDPLELEEEAVKEGWLPVPSEEQRRRFTDRVAAALDDLGL